MFLGHATLEQTVIHTHLTAASEAQTQASLTLVAWASRPLAENLSSALSELDSRKACLVSGLGSQADPRVAWLTGWKPVPRPYPCHG